MQVEKSMGQRQSLDNIEGMDAVWWSYQNVEGVDAKMLTPFEDMRQQ